MDRDEARSGISLHVRARYVGRVTGVPEFDRAEGPDYVWRQLADYLEARIRAGDLAPGARLRGEQAMREEYGVSLSTLRKALARLRERGLLVTTPSLGTFSSPGRTAAAGMTAVPANLTRADPGSACTRA